MRLNRKFYSRNTKTIAKDLLGKILVNGRCKGKIVETEAYFGATDPASHAFGKVTKRNILMYQKPGIAYVYFTYGNHWMFNVVTEREGVPSAVLIRALEPLEGIELMKKRRGKDKLKDLTNGPGKLTQAFGIDKSFDGLDLTKDRLFIEDSKEKPKIHKTTRIGLSKGQELLLRFYIKENEFVSRK
ncbi:MAG: DNA-3-methyladenine glycosylase [Candidatus Aenigmatarchaeota archaeon]